MIGSLGVGLGVSAQVSRYTLEQAFCVYSQNSMTHNWPACQLSQKVYNVAE
jgi:hypothetical protein